MPAFHPWFCGSFGYKTAKILNFLFQSINGFESWSHPRNAWFFLLCIFMLRIHHFGWCLQSLLMGFLGGYCPRAWERDFRLPLSLGQVIKMTIRRSTLFTMSKSNSGDICRLFHYKVQHPQTELIIIILLCISAHSVGHFDARAKVWKAHGNLKKPWKRNGLELFVRKKTYMPLVASEIEVI